MKIGIISDTHDDLDSLRSAIRIFKRERITYLIYAGDFVFPGVVDELKDLKPELPNIRIIAVLGNNDGEKLMLFKKFIEIGAELNAELADTVIKRIRVLNPGTAHRNFPNIEKKIEKIPSIIIYDTEDKRYHFVNLITDEAIEEPLKISRYCIS
jgi:predicted phosphodiesterase